MAKEDAEIIALLEERLPPFVLKDYMLVKRSSLRFHIFTWGVTLAALVGVWLNIYKMKECFYIWSVTNAAWAVVDWKKGIYAQSVLHIVYFISAVWGILIW